MSQRVSPDGLTPSDESSLIEPGSRVVLIGPFQTQLFDLSSSESESSRSASPCESLTEAAWRPRPSPITPTCARRRAQALAGSPAAATDWVAYGEEEEGFTDLEYDLSSVNISDASSSFRYNNDEDLNSEGPSQVSDSPVSVVLTDRPSYRDLPPDTFRPSDFPQRALPSSSLRSRTLPPSTQALSTGATEMDQIAVYPAYHRGCNNKSLSHPIPPQPAPVYKLTPIIIEPYTLALHKVQPVIETTPVAIPAHAASPAARDVHVSDVAHNPDDRLNAEAELLPQDEYICSACEGRSKRMIHLLPCRDIACPSCFSSSVAAVSVTQGVSKCPACLTAVTSFEPFQPSSYVPFRPPMRPKLEKIEPIVMRIDNVAWDIEPHIVEKFLPPNSLPQGHLHPIHICLDRRDGRTKDYLYVEVASQAAARRVLQQRQNVYMPGGKITGGRMRAVTISQVQHDELVREVQPTCKEELMSLLELCEAALTTPTPQLRMDTFGRGRLHASTGANGKAHYIKYRHAPYHALMSLLAKAGGRDSPAHWDIHHVATGAISALASAVKATPWDAHGDGALLDRLIATFDATFDNTRKTH